MQTPRLSTGLRPGIPARSTALLAVVLLSGCSLLFDFDPSGSPCAATEPYCLDGFVCARGNVCLPEDEGGCSPECGKLEACEKSECVPVCEKDGLVRACAAGELCEGGECVPAPQDKSLGAQCTQDSDCDPPGVCLVPYSGAASVPAAERKGFCTKPCATDDTCGGAAPRCQTFTGEGALTTSLCAPVSFLGCESEGDCPAELTCGVYAVRPVAWQAVLACRARITSNTPGSIGGACTPGIPCVNGLCVLDNSSDQSTSCSTPCTSVEDCRTAISGTDSVCSVVTLLADPAGGLPRLRPRLCVKDGARLLAPCVANARCASDAPYCATFTEGGTPTCVPACGEGSGTVDCPGSAPRCIAGTATSPGGTTSGQFCSP